MTTALLKTLHNPPSISVTAHSRDKRRSHHSLHTNLSAGALRPPSITPNRTETILLEFSDADANQNARFIKTSNRPSFQLSEFVWGLGGHRTATIPGGSVVSLRHVLGQQEVLYLNISWPSVPPSTLMQQIMMHEYLQLLYRREVTSIDFKSTALRRISVSGCLPVPHAKWM